MLRDMGGYTAVFTFAASEAAIDAPNKGKKKCGRYI